MKNAMLILPVTAVLGVFACSGEKAALPAALPAVPAAVLPAVLPAEGVGAEAPAAGFRLEEIAEIERAGGYYPGMGLAESAIREGAGDWTGAVVAAYKELSWAYGYDGGRQGAEALRKLEAAFEESGGAEKRGAAGAVRGVLAFSEGRWDEAGELLKGLGSDDEEPDSFLRWMLLVCALERGEGAPVRSVYSSIRARYGLFPEYWYRGARAFASGAAANIAAEYAEHCVNLSPRGPFAEECRGIIAAGLGLDSGSEAVRSKAEIEDAIRRSVSSGKPELLEDLFPLISLPDNAYTLYAIGALRAVSSVPVFKEFLSHAAAGASGRLAERFNFILRG